MNLIEYEMVLGGYGQVRFFPLLLANKVNTSLEEWFINYKYLHFSTDQDLKGQFEKFHLNIEFSYSMRTRERSHEAMKLDVNRLIEYCQFQELFRILVEALESAYQLHQIAVSKKEGASVSDFKSLIEKRSKEFHGMPFPVKIKKFEVNEKSKNFLHALVAISKARNCLEHRGGVIGPKDCNRGNKLILKARYPTLVDETGKASGIFDQINEMKISPISFIEEEIKFREGDKMTIGFNDSYKIIYNINFALKGIIDWIYECCESEEQTPIIKQFRS